MKVLYDHQAFTMQYYGGVSKSFCELISHLPKDVSVEMGVMQSNNVHLAESGLCPMLEAVGHDYKTFLPHFHFRGKGHMYLWLNRLFPSFPSVEHVNKRRAVELLQSGDFDVFHPTFFDDYFLPYLNGKPFVLTVHDMMPELFPQYFSRNDRQIVGKRKLTEKANAIIAVSKRTKRDLMEILKVPEDRIHVIYHGGPARERIPDKALIDEPYFLYMGMRGAYKNFHQLITDFGKFSENCKKTLLVCTGGEFTRQEKKVFRKHNILDRVVHFPATDEDVKNLYAHAVAFVYPSLYEGFGMPILKAFAYGCPVLLNNKSCFPEIAGDAGVYFLSDDQGSDLAEKLKTASSWSDEERAGIIQLGYERLNSYSWQKSARQLRDLYVSIIWR